MNTALKAFIDAGGDPKAVEQGSDIWKQIRLGFVTASGIADIFTKSREGKESLTRYKYKVRLVAERLSEVAQESFVSSAMEWGVQQERFACIEYETQRDVLLDKTGFWLHPTLPWIGVSPDRLVDNDGLVEIKCPNTSTHLNYIFEKKVPETYWAQIQCQLWVTGRKWCDFVSFDPRLPPRNRLFICRADRDDEYIKNMEKEVLIFLDEVQSLITKLES